MRARTAVAALGLAMLACGGRHDPPPDIIERAGGAALLREGALAVRSLAPQGDGEVVVSMDRWPEAFRRRGPEMVSVDKLGVDVTLNIDTFYSSGVYVAFDASRPPSGLGDDLSFLQLAPGIYWYRLLMGG